MSDDLTLEEYTKITRDYAAALRMQVAGINEIVTSTTSRFAKYTKDDITGYLQNPETYEKQIRDASIYMYANSLQYYNLINHYALMPVWEYVLTPLKFDQNDVNPDALYKQFLKVSQKVQNMNLAHELIKVMRTCFREDVFYGICLESKDSFFIYRLNPDYCKIVSIEDGLYNFAFDCSMILEDDLILYPEVITQLWKAYQKDNSLRWQEIPSDIGICIKVNEDLLYPLPPFAASMPLLYDIEDYKDLIKARTEIDIYKLIAMKVPVDDQNVPMDIDVATQYYRHVAGVLPDNVGVVMTPMQLEGINLTKSGLSDTDEVARAEQHFWSTTGTSPLLFGADTTGSVTALKLSIKASEEIVLAVMRQVERWINRRIKKVPGSIKFKCKVLPLTHYNLEEKVNMYKEAATYGLPVKSMYAASQDLEPNDMSAMTTLENEILKFPDKFIPLSSTHTQSATESEGGRPTNEENGKDLTDSGEQTQRDDENANRAQV